MCKDLGFEMYGEISLLVTTDSAAALGIAVRRGVGKVRHLETGALWVQAAIEAKRFEIGKVDGKKNTSDLMTKAVDRETLSRHLVALCMKISRTRPIEAPGAIEGSTIFSAASAGTSQEQSPSS